MKYIEPFVRVAERSSFRGAAQRLGVSPAAVSKAVARLEEELGVRLFDRTSRRVDLTEEGAAFLPYAQRALDQLQAGLDEVAETRAQVRGVLRLSVPYLIAPALLDPLSDLQSRHPHLTFDLRVTDVLDDLAAAGVDAAIRIGLPDPASDLVVRKVRTLRWITVASPAYVATHGVPTEATLDQHRCGVFVSPEGRPVPWTLSRGPRAVSAALTVNHGSLLVDAAVSGLCVAQVFRGMVREPLARGELVNVFPDASIEGPPLSLVYLPGRRQVPRVRAFLEFIVDRLENTL